jgi:hypothetical protein
MILMTALTELIIFFRRKHSALRRLVKHFYMSDNLFFY